MSALPVGSKVKTFERMSPRREAGRRATVIPFEEFAKGEPATRAAYQWPLPEIQSATFIRFLDGPVKGKVSMARESILSPDPEAKPEPADAAREARAKAGERLAKALGLRKARGFDPPRWTMGREFGTRTAEGVYAVAQRLAEEARQEAMGGGLVAACLEERGRE